jgi:hypothetical protein
MAYGFDTKKYYMITTVPVHYTERNSAIGFVKYPDSPDKELLRHRELVRKEVEQVEKETGAKFCHLEFYKSSLPYRFVFVFDLGLSDNTIFNKMKLKCPAMVDNIRADDDDYVRMLKENYENNEVYHHEGYTAFIY